ncbi:hypothetical protein ACLOAV_007580 [Pseudogymnoascus australis]
MALLPSLYLFILATNLGLVAAADVEALCTWEGLDSSFGKSYTPWFRGWKNVTSGPGGSDEAFVKNMACWWYADCIFSLAPETGKQQYAAISIVMALIPLILKDIAWPHRRLVLSLKKKHWLVEILIRALGLNPVVTRDQTEIKEGRKFNNRWASRIVLVLLVGFLLLAYGMLAVMEVYSKRSSLGCPVPAFVVLWFVIALAPAAVEVAFSRFRDRTKRPSLTPVEASESGNDEALHGSNGNKQNTTAVVSESIQGGDQNWIVQFCWGLYYSAGGLIFTSIMLVSVVELFTWMLLAGVFTFCELLVIANNILYYYIILVSNSA